MTLDVRMSRALKAGGVAAIHGPWFRSRSERAIARLYLHLSGVHGRQHATLEEPVSQRQMEAVDAQAVEFPHAVKNRRWTADEPGRQPLVGVECGQPIVGAGPHPLGTVYALASPRHHRWIVTRNHRLDRRLSSEIGVAADRNAVKRKAKGSPGQLRPA